jgi:hypothetical protein
MRGGANQSTLPPRTYEQVKEAVREFQARGGIIRKFAAVVENHQLTTHYHYHFDPGELKKP